MHLDQFSAPLKIRFHHKWLEDYRLGKAVAPISVEMDLTNRCNYGCPNCVWGEYIGGNRTHMPLEHALKQIADVAEAGVKAVIFSGGGEPLLNSATPKAMKFAKTLGLDVGLFSNGLLIDSDVAEVLANHCDWVRIHLDGASPEIYAERHQIEPSKLNLVITRLEQLNNLGRACNSKLFVGIGSVINSRNFQDLDGLCAIAKDTGCQYFQAKHDFELIADLTYNKWWAEEVVPQLQALESKLGSPQFRIQYTTANYARRPKADRCHIHHLTTAVNAEGDLAYCKRLRDTKDWSPGNLKHNSLRVLVEGNQNRQLSREITPHNCGIQCPYFELNELIDQLIASEDLGAPEAIDEIPHINFF